MAIQFTINDPGVADFTRPGRRSNGEGVATRIVHKVVGREVEIMNAATDSFLIKFLDESYLYFGFSGDTPVVIYTAPHRSS